MEKENKYYGIIENLVKKHKKFPGLESILEDIIDDVYSHSEVIIKTVTNEDVINAYLEKVVSTSIITVPKKMNFHPEIKHKSFIREHNTIKVDQKLIDKMINAPEIIKPIEPVAEEVKQEEISVEEEHPQIIQEPITDGSVNIDTIELDMQPEPYKTQEVASLDFEQAETEEAEETVTTNLSSDVQNIDNSIDLGNFTETIPDDLSINFADDNNDINELADEPISLDTEEISEAPLAIEEPEQFKSDEVIEPAEIILPETLEAEQNEVLDLSEDASIEEFNEGLEVEAPEEDITESSTDFTDLVEVIYDSGGIPVIAHPYDIDIAEKLIKDLMNCGLRGIEAYHRKHSPAIVEYFSSMAENLGLIVTGGSDFHAPNIMNGQIILGKNFVPEWIYDSLINEKKHLDMARG